MSEEMTAAVLHIYAKEAVASLPAKVIHYPPNNKGRFDHTVIIYRATEKLGCKSNRDILAGWYGSSYHLMSRSFLLFDGVTDSSDLTDRLGTIEIDDPEFGEKLRAHVEEYV